MAMSPSPIGITSLHHQDTPTINPLLPPSTWTPLFAFASSPCLSGAGGLTSLLVLFGSVLAVARALLVVGVKVGAVVVLGLGLGIQVKHVIALLHLLQQLVHGLREGEEVLVSEGCMNAKTPAWWGRRRRSDLLRVPAGEGEVLQGGADGALLLGTLQSG